MTLKYLTKVELKINGAGAGELLEAGAWREQLGVKRHQMVFCIAHAGQIGDGDGDDDDDGDGDDDGDDGELF